MAGSGGKSDMGRKASRDRSRSRDRDRRKRSRSKDKKEKRKRDRSRDKRKRSESRSRSKDKDRKHKKSKKSKSESDDKKLEEVSVKQEVTVKHENGHVKAEPVVAPVVVEDPLARVTNSSTPLKSFFFRNHPVEHELTYHFNNRKSV
jgi:hypothetical protein